MRTRLADHTLAGFGLAALLLAPLPATAQRFATFEGDAPAINAFFVVHKSTFVSVGERVYVTSSMAQRFTVGPAFPRLTSVSLWTYPSWSDAGADRLRYRTHLYQWSSAGMRPVGAPLWQSAVQVAPAWDYDTQFAATRTTFAVPALALDPGAEYAAVFSAVGVLGLTRMPPVEGTTAQASADLVFGSLAGSGLGAPQAFGYAASWSDDPATLNRTWWQEQPGFHVAFEATFAAAPATTVPEPATAALVGLGLAGAGAVARRRGRA